MNTKQNIQNSTEASNDGNTVLAAVQLTAEELSLLQSILACMNDRLDWDFTKENGLIEASVLLEFDESVPRIVNTIYDKLFDV